MAFLLQLLVIIGVVAIFTVGPYSLATRIAVARGAAHEGKVGRNRFGLRSEPRFYGLLAIFVAVLPALLVSLIGLGYYVPSATQGLGRDLITARLDAPVGDAGLAVGLDPAMTYLEFAELGFGEAPLEASRGQGQLKSVLQLQAPDNETASECIGQIANVITVGGALENLPPCSQDGFALGFFDGLGEARLVAEDRVVSRTYLAILIAGVLGFAASFLVAVPAFAARQVQEWVTLGLLAAASLVAILAMVALIATLAGNTRGFMKFGQSYNYGGPLRLPDWAQKAYAGIDMDAFNRASEKVERRDFIDEAAVGQVLMAGQRVAEPVMAEDADGSLYQVDSRDKWAVALQGEALNLGLNRQQMDFLERVQRNKGRLGKADVQRLLILAPELVEPFLDTVAFEAAVAQAEADREAAEAAARLKYEAFIASRVAAQGDDSFMCGYSPRDGVAALSDQYVETYLGFSAAAIAEGLPRTAGESEADYDARLAARMDFYCDEEITSAQRKYASAQRKRTFLYFQDLSDRQRANHWIRDFLSWDYKPGAANSAEEPSHRFGVLSIFYGTFAIATMALLVAVPMGLLAAVFVGQFAPAPIRAIAKPALEVLAGIPTIVYGFFALLAVAPALQGSFEFFEYHSWQWVRDAYNALGLETPGRRMALVAGMVMGFMLIPFISSTTEDALSAVPKGMKDGALALGSTKTESLFRVQFFAALPGIVGGILLAISRAIGETMIVFVAAGASPNALFTLNPLEPQTTATVIIASRFGGAEDSEGTGVVFMAFTIGFVLLMLTLVLNMAAIYVVRKFRARYE